MPKKSKNRSRAQQQQARVKAAASRSQYAATPSTPAAKPSSKPSSKGPANRSRRLAPEQPQRSRVRSGLGRPMVIGIIGLVVLGGWFGWQWLQSRKGPEPLTFATPAASLSPNPDLAGLQTDDPPWDAALGSLRERLEQLGLPVLTAEDLSLHFHVHLDVRVDGKPVAVPDDIGRNEGAGYITVIHTHTEDGIIHIESPKGHEYTLGQVFDVWGVQLNDECLGGLCNEGDQKLRVYADGELLDPAEVRLLILSSHQEIVVTYGTADQVPNPLPSRYSFPLGS